MAAVLPAPLKRFIKAQLRRWRPAPEPSPAPPRAASAPPTPPPPRHVEIALPDRPPLVLDSPGHLYIPLVLQQKPLAQYEPYAIDCFLATLEQAGPGAVFDIGANVGLYALLAATYTDRLVVAFEPAPDTAAVARSAASANGLVVTVEEIALSDSDGTATLYLSDRSDSSNSLNPEFRAHSQEIVVPTEMLDTYVSRTGLTPAVIKVDTETTEPDVLAGGRSVIAQHRPWILCEVLHGRVEERLHAVMDGLGYTYYHLDGPGPHESVEKIVGDPTSTHFMFLFSPEPVGPEFWDRMNDWRARLSAQ